MEQAEDTYIDTDNQEIDENDPIFAKLRQVIKKEIINKGW